MPVSFMKVGDTAPPLTIDTNTDVTGATSLLAKIRRRHQSTVMSKTLSVVGPATDGVLQYQWVSPDTDVVGTYEIEAVVTYASGKVQRFPARSDLELVIGPKVG